MHPISRASTRSGVSCRWLNSSNPVPWRRVARSFGVKRPGPLFNRRATFVIDTDRRVLASYSSEVNMEMHAERPLELLKDRATSG